MPYTVISQSALQWLWDKAQISPDEAQENGHVRSLMAVMERVRHPEGEAYVPRGIGLNWLPCFVCGSHVEHQVQPDMAAFVVDKAAGERIIKMFEMAGAKAKLDFRASEPNWVQVKVGACARHEANLKLLQARCGIDERITVERIRYCL